MRRPWFVVICVLLVQRAASQALCQSDLSISIDDLLRAINSGQLNLNQGNLGQDVCGCQNIALPMQNPCGCQNSIQQPFPYNNQISGYQPSFQANQQSGCGCQLPSIFGNQPSLSLGNQATALSQLQCGCNQQQSIPFANQPPLSIGNQIYGAQQGVSRGQQSCGCGNQPSSQPRISLNNLCGYQPSFQNQQPSISIASQPLSLPSQQTTCGTQKSISARPSANLQRGSSQKSYAQPTFSLNSLSQSCQQSAKSQSSNRCSSQTQSANVGADIAIPYVANIGNNVVNVVPNALLQAPPFGIFFEGENLLIDGAVQVCGSMPFNSAVQVSGVMPASGIGNVQYVCNDVCQ